MFISNREKIESIYSTTSAIREEQERVRLEGTSREQGLYECLPDNHFFNHSHPYYSKRMKNRKFFVGLSLSIILEGIKTYRTLGRRKLVPGFSTTILFSFGDPVTPGLSGFTEFVSCSKRLPIPITYAHLIATTAGSGKTVLA